MARGVNKAILLGNLGNDPEVRYTPSGSAVANINLATTETWRDKITGDVQDRTEWHRVVFFNRLAEIVGEYLRKGSKIYVEGSMRTRRWIDKNQIERHTTEIVANEMTILDSRTRTERPLEAPIASPQEEMTPAAALTEPLTTTGGREDPYMEDDDIPF